MIIYEVNIDLDRTIEKAYRSWLTPHIKELLKCEGFSTAFIFERESKDKSSVGLTVQYHVASQANLDGYLKNNAPRLRQEALDLFKDKFTITRRTLLRSARIDSGE